MFNKCKYDKKLFRLAKEINATSVITKIIAFQPPKKGKLNSFNLNSAMYSIQALQGSNTPCSGKNQKHCSRYERVKFVHDIYSNITHKWIEETSYLFKNTHEKSKNRDKNIVILHLKNKNKSPNGFTLIVSHGNASTLGTLYSTLIDICTQLKCDVLAYDYSGYGRSGGKPSEKDIYFDIEEVGFFAKNILNIPTKDIVLLGISLGSAPSVHLAIHKQFRDIRAMILISPIASGVKLVSPEMDVKDLDKIDVFCNIRKINDVTSPIFLVHGKLDEVIPIEQSLEMANYMQNVYEWHPRHGDHNNILSKYRTKFFQKCKFFFEYLNYHTKRSPHGNSISTFNFGEKAQFDGIHHYIEESYIRDDTQANGMTCKKKETCFIEKTGDNRNIDLDLKFPKERYSNTPFGMDLPFDFCSEGSINKKSGVFESSSKEEWVYFKDNKELEEQYNIMLKKHNGI